MPPGVYPRPSGNTIAERLDYYSIPEPNCGCRLWTGGIVHEFGYGYLKVDGRHVGAHILQWERYNGPVPPGMQVLHRCDMPPCIEETHLFLGTMSDNMRDKIAKRRHIFGERHPSSKLTAAVIPAIRADQRRHAVIADDYGVHKSLISQVKRGVIWGHIT